MIDVHVVVARVHVWSWMFVVVFPLSVHRALTRTPRSSVVAAVVLLPWRVMSRSILMMR